MGATYEHVTWPQTTVPVFLKDRYAFTKERGWHWLQHACLWVLRKLGCNAVEDTIHWSQRRFQTREIGEAILKQHEEVWRFVRSHDCEAMCVLMSDEDFRKVLTNADRDAPYGPMSLNASARIGRACASGPRYELYGFRVVVLPWITGVHVVPTKYFREAA